MRRTSHRHPVAHNLARRLAPAMSARAELYGPDRPVLSDEEAPGEVDGRVAMARHPRGEDDASRLLRMVWWDSPVPEGLPVDTARIATGLGIRVHRSKLADGVACVLVGTPGEDPKIYLNREDSRSRRRYACAHALGHYRARVEAGEETYEVVDMRDALAAESEDADETYANAYACGLLMPAALLGRLYRAEPDAVLLAYRFGVAADTMNFRLTQLGLR